MNEKGEAILFAVLTLVALTGTMLLCSLELNRSYRLITRRSGLFLCTREIKGELNNYLRSMGRSNWAIKNIQKAKWVMAFIPGLQGAAANSEKARALLKAHQDANLLLYLLRLRKISARGCSLDPEIFLTPYKLRAKGYARDFQGAAIRRKDKWIYNFTRYPYSLSLEIDGAQTEKVNPEIIFLARENVAKLSSPLSIAW